MPKNLGVWRSWKLGECISGYMETSGAVIARVETWHSCTLETFGVHSWYSGTSVAFARLVELRARSVIGVFVLLFRISGNSVAFVVLLKPRF